jgi:glycosyltransferase involved in cell wall biosynthesis
VKIAIVTGSAGDTRCGVGDYAYELAQHLSLDAEVHLFFDKTHGPASPPFEKLSSLVLHPLQGYSVFYLPGVVKELREGEFDIVHVQYPSKGFGNSPAPAFIPQSLSGMNSRSRIVATLHEWSAVHPLRVMVMDQMLPHIDALIVTNEYELEKLVDKVKGRSVTAIPVGNVLSSRAELEAVWLEAEGKPVPPPSTAGPGGRVPYSLFHYGLPTTKGRGLKRLLEAIKIARSAGKPLVLHLGGDFAVGSKENEELLNLITEYELQGAITRLGHIPRERLAEEALRCMLGVFPFDEGYSSKRSSVAALTHLDLPLLVGAGSSEIDHPFMTPKENNAASLAVLLTELFSGKLEADWAAQVARQREYGRRFSFTNLAESHMSIYQRLVRQDMRTDWRN